MYSKESILSENCSLQFGRAIRNPRSGSRQNPGLAEAMIGFHCLVRARLLAQALNQVKWEAIQYTRWFPQAPVEGDGTRELRDER